MIITGKCLEKYNEFLLEKYGILHCNVSIDTCQHVLIIDFFDSVGIYVFPCLNFQFGFEIFIDGELENVCIGIDFNSRTEATTEAIKKANEIFNNR